MPEALFQQTHASSTPVREMGANDDSSSAVGSAAADCFVSYENVGTGAIVAVEGASCTHMALSSASHGECALCLDDLADACISPCRHVFCRECILKALATHAPTWKGKCPLCRNDVSIYTIKDLVSGEPLATPEIANLYGTVFVQPLGIGVASYHFDSEGECYISYSNAPSSWTLADGSAVPPKKRFEQCSWDLSTRTFRGTVSWEPSFDGSSRWEYEVVFAEDFSGIVGGAVHDFPSQRVVPFRAPWSPHEQGLSYQRWKPPPTTIYGGVYVQGLVYSSVLEGMASYHFDAEDDCYISFANAPHDWVLDDGKVLPEKKHFTNVNFDEATRTFTGDVTWNPPMRGAAKWECSMVFSVDFCRVEGGLFKSFRADGSQLPIVVFGDPRTCMSGLPPRGGELMYVRKPDFLVQMC